MPFDLPFSAVGGDAPKEILDELGRRAPEGDAWPRPRSAGEWARSKVGSARNVGTEGDGGRCTSAAFSFPVDGQGTKRTCGRWTSDRWTMCTARASTRPTSIAASSLSFPSSLISSTAHEAGASRSRTRRDLLEEELDEGIESIDGFACRARCELGPSPTDDDNVDAGSLRGPEVDLRFWTRRMGSWSGAPAVRRGGKAE
jgi:hypothetical protein